MFFHRDTLLTSSWQVQLVGAKKWHVCAPSQEPYLYHAGQPYPHKLLLLFFIAVKLVSIVSRLLYDFTCVFSE